MHAQTPGIDMVIKYQNRKLYFVKARRYVTLVEIAEMVRLGSNMVVIDSRTKNDITAETLTAAVFEEQKRHQRYASLSRLREIIQNGAIL